MSGGSDSVTNVSSVPAWVQPYAENYMQRSQQVADMPYQAYGGQTVAQLNPYQTGAYDAMAQRAMQGSPVNDAASGELTKTLSGGYLGANPYLDKMVESAQGDVLKGYNNTVRPAQDALMARSGSFGNAGVQSTINDQQSDLTRNLGNLSASIRGTDYGNERSRMTSAIGMAPSIANQDYVDADALQRAGAGYQGQEQRNLTDQYGRFQEARDYSKDQLATLGRGVGMNFGTSNTSTGPGSNPYAQAIGTGLAAYGAYNSGGGK